MFGALVAEEQALRDLYAPLHRRIEEDPRLAKLAFVVQREVDVDGWASRGESLLDLRKPPFNHRGALAERARASLLPAWQQGSPAEVRAAMHAFVEEYGGIAIEALAQGSTPLDLGEWLFSTDHISVKYGILYEGVEIGRLSPGSRRKLVRLVTDAGVVSEGDPLAPTDLRQPVFVGTLGCEVIAVSLDREARALQDLREERAEVAIGEEDKRQAARS